MGAALQIRQFPCLQDNVGYLVHDPDARLTAAIDTPDAVAISRALADAGWTLDYVLNTHHHWDHSGGNLALKEQTGCTVIGARADAARIPGIDVQVGDGDTFSLGSHQARIVQTAGHTSGHLCYVFDADHIAFTGDTLFAMGCGRLFEGTPAHMWSSLQKLMALRDETQVYCGHEYTQKNGRFALTLEPRNQALVARMRDVDALRAANRSTLPTTIGLEKATNPFMRPDSAELRGTLALQGATNEEVLAEIRRRKDRF